MYEELFGNFGRHANIKDIEAKGMKNISRLHCLPQLLGQDTNQLQKIQFENCAFNKIDDILVQHINVEHLVLRSVRSNSSFVLPNYRNLKKMELKECGPDIFFENLTQIIRNNHELESLILDNSGNFSWLDVMLIIADSPVMLTELDLTLDTTDFSMLSDDAIL